MVERQKMITDEDMQSGISFERAYMKNTRVYDYFDYNMTLTALQGPIKKEVPSKFLQDVDLPFGRNWKQIWRSIHRPTDGQEKNFLVAVRTVSQAPSGKYNIVVAGSKTQSVGGLWHSFFNDYVADRHPGSQITYYDLHEIESEQEWRGIRVVHTKKILESYEADIFIDDVWTEDGLGIQFKARYYSKKGQGSYFLINEKRFFSHKKERLIGTECPCARCQVIEELSDSFEQSEWLKDCMAQISGYRCATYRSAADYFNAENRTISSQLKSVVRGGELLQDTPLQRRQGEVVKKLIIEPKKLDLSYLPTGWQKYMRADWEDLQCAHTNCSCRVRLYSLSAGEKLVQADQTEQIVSFYNAISKFERLEDECQEVRGLRVVFQDVAPDFFFPTKLNTTPGPPDVAVIGGVPRHINTAPIVFSKVLLPGYSSTELSWKGYVMQVRSQSSSQTLHTRLLGKMEVEINSSILALQTEIKDHIADPISVFRLRVVQGKWKEDKEGPILLKIWQDGNFSVVMDKKSAPRTSRMPDPQSLLRLFLSGIDLKKPRTEATARERAKEVIFDMYIQGKVKGFLSRVIKCLPKDIVFLIRRMV